MADQFLKQKKGLILSRQVDMGRGEVWVGIRVRVSRNIPSHNTGTTRGPHEISCFLYSILGNDSSVR